MGNLALASVGAANASQQPQQKQVKTTQQSVSFFDEKWSGHQIEKLVGDNFFTDWLQDKDKVCTDGKDDGKLGFWESTKSIAKGLIGGIPKMIINHPVATLVMGAAVPLTGGAILPVLGAVGLVAGIGMVGYSGYKAANATTDSEAKIALETMGTGITTTALSVKSVDTVLKTAANAGVKSAQVSEDAGFFQKMLQMFKAIPESLTKSKEWTLSYLKGTPVNIELANGTTQTKVRGKLLKEEFADGSCNTYSKEGYIIDGVIDNGSVKEYYKDGYLVKKEFADGTCNTYYKSEQIKDGTLLSEDGYTKKIYKNGDLIAKEDILTKEQETALYELGGKRGYREGYIRYDANGKEIETHYISYDKEGKMLYQNDFANNKRAEVYFDDNGNIIEKINVNGNVRENCYFDGNGKLVKKIYNDGNTYSEYDGNGNVVEFKDLFANRQKNEIAATQKGFLNAKTPRERDMFREHLDIVKNAKTVAEIDDSPYSVYGSIDPESRVIIKKVRHFTPEEIAKQEWERFLAECEREQVDDWAMKMFAPYKDMIPQ